MGLTIGILAQNTKMAIYALDEILKIENSPIKKRTKTGALLEDGTTYFAFSTNAQKGVRLDQIFIVDDDYDDDLMECIHFMLCWSNVPYEQRVQIINFNLDLSFEMDEESNYKALWG